jgi:hypothetical protein
MSNIEPNYRGINIFRPKLFFVSILPINYFDFSI